ncbi:NAD(P)-dependent oxidoreductase [Pararhodobacter sp. SW119]|uniref:NAD-dependent epimerase/dehydratase family protein n=1 Tax=Pararhodobacter sp. SW119 TaxID=2780075 RepID=UPI001AE03C2F|nr:NAD(P)-dependent oxidoreductase [Pararhodobacter sp. SW119]
MPRSDSATTPELLVIGASGRVGRLLSSHWAAAGAPVCLQTRAARLRAALPFMRWSPLDEGAAALRAYVRSAGTPRAMVMFAGVTPSSGDDASMTLNGRLAAACLQAADEAGIGRVLLASSAAVYGLGRAAPWREDEAPAVAPSAYGAAKRAMEAAASEWRQRGLSVCCMRIGNVAGADALLLNAPGPLAIDRFPNGGGPVRSYIGPMSLTRVIETLAELPDLPPVLNVAAPAPMAMVELARATGFAWHWQKAPPDAVERLTLDCRALCRVVHFAPRESTAAEMVAQWRACTEAG